MISYVMKNYPKCNKLVHKYYKDNKDGETMLTVTKKLI